MERGEGEMSAVKPKACHTVSRSDTLQDARPGLEHDSNLNGLSSDRSEELSGAERSVMGSLSRSGKTKRSARAASNLRKSLAWDKAFSTDEGVLDVDELPLVTKTPRKPLELHLLDIPEILGKVCPGPHPVRENHNPNIRAVDRVEMITSSPVLSSRHLESHSSGSPGSPNSRTFETTLSECSSPVVAPSNPDTKTSKLDSKSSASVSQIVKADALKATRLRLPSSFTGKRGKSDMVPKPVSVPQSNFLRRCKSSSSILSPSSASAAFSKKVSSVSKKVKDTLGKVLPGSLGSSAKHFKVKEDWAFHQGQAAKTMQTPMSHRHATEDDVKSTRPASVANSRSITKKGATVEANNQAVMPTEQLVNGAIIPGLTGSSQGSVAGTSSKKGNQSFYSTQVRPWISRKKLGSEGSQSPQSSKGASSGLRLPSPKIGFFDSPRSASGEHPTTLPERGIGSALDTSNSKNSRKGLPPRPKPGLPSGRVQKPGCDDSLAKVSTKLVSSGIPTAPHLRPFGKSAEGLVRSASAPTSPHSNHHGIRPSASHPSVTGRRLSSQANSDQSHSCVSELRTRTLRNAASGAFQNESRDCESVQSLNPLGPLEVDALPQVMGKPSGRSSTGYKQRVKIEWNSGGDKSPTKLANLSVGSIKLPTERSLSGSLPSEIEDSRGVNESVFCREKEGTTHNVSGELTVSSSFHPLVDTVCHKLPPSTLDGTLCPELDRVSSAQSASTPELKSCLGKEIFDKSMGHSVGENVLGSGGDNPRMANLDLGRILGHDLRLKNGHKIEDSSKFSEVESSVNLRMFCCAKGQLILEDSPKATTSGNEELSRNTPKIEDSKMMSRGKFTTEEQAQKLRSISPARRPEEYAEKNDSSLDSPSTWSDWSLLAATNKLSSQPSLGQEHTPASTPIFERHSYTRTVTAGNTQTNTPESYVRGASPASASDAQSSKHPLAVNAGLMNGISKRTSLSASRKERNLRIDFEQPASESTSGQENKRCLDGQLGGTQPHKPKQRKSNSSHRLDQSEAYEDRFSEERLRALEAAGQHSPPNKTSPNSPGLR